MVSTSVTIKVTKNISTQDKDIYIYRGDRNIKVYFTIEAPFKYSDDMDVENSNAVYAAKIANGIAEVFTKKVSEICANSFYSQNSINNYFKKYFEKFIKKTLFFARVMAVYSH